MEKIESTKYSAPTYQPLFRRKKKEQDGKYVLSNRALMTEMHVSVTLCPPLHNFTTDLVKLVEALV